MAERFNENLRNIGKESKKLEYIPVEILRVSDRPEGHNHLLLEYFIEGDYLKFNNNYGYVDRELEKNNSILQAFSHFTYNYSKAMIMVTDVQGAIQNTEYKLTDPAIHTFDEKNLLPDKTNKGLRGMASFFISHRCNDFCKALGLINPKMEEFIPKVENLQKVTEQSQDSRSSRYGSCASSKGISIGSNLGNIEEYTIVDPGWQINSEWGGAEICFIYTFPDYQDRELNALLYLKFEIVNTKKISAQAKITNNPFEQGEFRLAYKSKIIRTESFAKDENNMIAKRYRNVENRSSLPILIKQVHIQHIAIFMARQFNRRLKNLKIKSKEIVYIDVEILNSPFSPRGSPYWSLENLIEGSYLKFNNNFGYVNRELENDHSVLQTFSHFTYDCSKGLMMITDIQGAFNPDKYILTDPAIHTIDYKILLPDRANRGTAGIDRFFQTHMCNDFCRQLNLKTPSFLDFISQPEIESESKHLK